MNNKSSEQPTFATFPPVAEAVDGFNEWAKSKGLVGVVGGIRFENNMLDQFRKCWNDALSQAQTADQSGADERAKFEAWYVTKYVIGASTFKGTCPPNGKWYYFDDEIDCAWQAWKAALASTQPAPQAAPMFWYRPLRDGLYEGPVHANSVGGKMMRDEKPDEWQPLYATPQPFPAPAVQSGHLQDFMNAAAEAGVTSLRNIQFDGADDPHSPAVQSGGEVVGLVYGTDNHSGLGCHTNLYKMLPIGTKLYAALPTQAIAVEALRNQALEEAALSCKNTMLMNVESYCGATASVCADRIRALKTAAPSQGAKQ